MRDLQIVVNEEIIDIDNDTAFGVSFKGFDFNEADKIHLSSSNNFSVPITKKNRKVFGFPDNMNLNSFSPNDAYYDKLNVKVFADGQFLFAGKCYVDKVENNRLDLYLVGGKNFLEELSKMTMEKVTEIAVDKLNVALDTLFPTGATWAQIVSFMTSGDNDIWMPYAIGTLNKEYPATRVQDGVTALYNKYEEDISYNLEDETHICTEFITNTEVEGDYKTGHFFVKLKSLLDWTLEYIGFSSSYDSTLLSNLSSDYVRMVDIVTYQDLVTGFYSFRADNGYKCKIADKEGKSFSKKIKAIDFFKTVVQEYAIVFDVSNNNNVSFKCFNDIKNNRVKNYKFKNITSRKFTIDGVEQISWIGYASLQGDGKDAVTTGGVQLVCNNKNIEVGNKDSVAFSIKRLLVGYFTYMYDNGSVQEETKALDLSSDKAMEEIVIARKDASQTAYSVRVSRYYNGSETYATAQLYKATQSTVSSSGVYDLFAENVEYPEEIEFEAFIKTHDAFNFSSSNYVTIDGIPGHWYIEEISGYNPRLEAQTVKMKAMRIR